MLAPSRQACGGECDRVMVDQVEERDGRPMSIQLNGERSVRRGALAVTDNELKVW